MPGIFVLSNKGGRKPYILFRKSLRIANFLEIINSLKVTIMKTSFTSGLTIFSCLDTECFYSLVFVFLLINAPNISTCFERFFSFLQPSSPDDRSTKSTNKVACIRAANIVSTYIRDTCAKSTNAKNTSFAGDVYIKNAIIKGAYTENTYVKNVSTVKNLGIHLKSFLILEIKLFDTGLENKVVIR